MQLHQPQCLDEIERIDARLLVVSFAPLDKLRDWVPYFQKYFLDPYYEQNNLEPRADIFSRTCFLSDSTLSAYRAYGLGRNTALRAYGPRIVWQYFRWGLQRKPIKMPSQDTLQRGGDFVVGRDGRLTLVYVGRDQADRPPVAELLAALRK